MIDLAKVQQRKTTIFRQLTINVMLPPILALLLVGYFNFKNTKTILLDSQTAKNYIISDEITKVLEFQDIALDLVENQISDQMHNYSELICKDLVAYKGNVVDMDLKKLQSQIGMNPIMEDIYIIDTNGIVINTTFPADLGLDFFSFGEEHKNMLLGILKSGRFKDERFAIEASTKRLKKYSYQPTSDGKYIVELGVYSPEADQIIDFIKNTTSQMSQKFESVESVELFIGADKPFSLNKNARLEERHLSSLEKAFFGHDTISINEVIENKHLNYQFIYMDRKNTELYKNSVIQVISDRTADYQKLSWELIKFVLIFAVTLIVVVVLVYYKTKIITDPIKNLVMKVTRITHGHLDERAEVVGNNEITTLSTQFNKMIAELESYYNELEQKVADRTREILEQKEEIEAQRNAIEEQRNLLFEKNDNLEKANQEILTQKKHITDSIVYARRIQTAILPPQMLIDSLIPNNFILYKPKDIVSGDFYWCDLVGSLSTIAAVDCTGHGVPGAFMSIVGSNQLNMAVRENPNMSASEILDSLNRGVSETLRQDLLLAEDTGRERVRDGMDIALCMIDYGKNIVQFAGAYNPLYIVRNGELIEYKADKIAIGSFIDAPEKKYTCNTVEVQKGDMLYIFSDGYADQFGGEKGRKYMYKHFKEFLVSIADKPMDEQRNLLDEEHLNWRGETPQLDDVIVIGIRI